MYVGMFADVCPYVCVCMCASPCVVVSQILYVCTYISMRVHMDYAKYDMVYVCLYVCMHGYLVCMYVPCKLSNIHTRNHDGRIYVSGVDDGLLLGWLYVCMSICSCLFACDVICMH